MSHLNPKPKHSGQSKIFSCYNIAILSVAWLIALGNKIMMYRSISVKVEEHERLYCGSTILCAYCTYFLITPF